MLKVLFLKFSGFSVVGALSTLLSIGLLYIFDETMGMHGVVGYVLAYMLSIFFSYVMNAKVVYRTQCSMEKMMGFFMTYVSGMVLGAFLIWCGKNALPDVNEFLLSCCVVPITIVWNFLFVNKILSRDGGVRNAGKR